MLRMNFPHRREERKNRAEAAHIAWRLLTIDEQLKELSNRPGNSKRQIERLTKLRSMGHKIIPSGGMQAAKPIPVEDISLNKAPPKSDRKAMKARQKKLRADNA